VSKSFDKFFYVQNYHYKDIIQLSYKHKIDIAVDLQGHTRLSRFEIFLKRCAPIQVNFLTYPGTSGSSMIDYIIADKKLISNDMKKFYSEKIVYLPNSYQPNEEEKNINNKVFNKKELGLPEDKFIFCCFNSHQKINPSTFDVWCRILSENKSSVLWLLENNKFSTENIYKEANYRGIDNKRIIMELGYIVGVFLVFFKWISVIIFNFYALFKFRDKEKLVYIPLLLFVSVQLMLGTVSYTVSFISFIFWISLGLLFTSLNKENKIHG